MKYSLHQIYTVPGLHKLWQPGSLAARKLRENDKMKRKWRKNEEMETEWGNGEWFTLYISSFSLYYLPLSISCIENCHILSQNVKNGTFVANVIKNLAYALWENNSRLNSLRESSASCASLVLITLICPSRHYLPLNLFGLVSILASLNLGGSQSGLFSIYSFLNLFFSQSILFSIYSFLNLFFSESVLFQLFLALSVYK